MDSSEREKIFTKAITDIIQEHVHDDLSPLYVSAYFITLGAAMCKVRSLVSDAPLNAQMEFVNNHVNAGFKQGKEAYEATKC